MTSLFFLGCFCHLVVSQTLYEPSLAENTLLNNGVQTKSDTLLSTCEKRLQYEHTTSTELARNVLNLTSYLETTTIALMALQQKFNVTGQYCSVCLYLVVVIEFIDWDYSKIWNAYIFWRDTTAHVAHIPWSDSFNVTFLQS